MKRLRVLERDDCTCQRCKVKGGNLEIEHLFYIGLPWEIDSKWLVTVCHDCHQYLESIKYRRVEITDEYADVLYVVHLKTSGQCATN